MIARLIKWFFERIKLFFSKLKKAIIWLCRFIMTTALKLQKALMHFFFGGNLSKVDLSDKQKRSWGMRAFGQSSVFWITTLWFSITIAICSAINGFAPFDILAHIAGHNLLSSEAKYSIWRYAFAAIAGCIAFNILISKKHLLNGYQIKSYCGSIVSACAFMTISKIAYAYIRQAGII